MHNSTNLNQKSTAPSNKPTLKEYCDFIVEDLRDLLKDIQTTKEYSINMELKNHCEL